MQRAATSALPHQNPVSFRNVKPPAAAHYCGTAKVCRVAIHLHWAVGCDVSWAVRQTKSLDPDIYAVTSSVGCTIIIRIRIGLFQPHASGPLMK